MNNWLQSLTESYKQISIQKELENLIEQIHKEEPTLNENEIKDLILNELKVPSADQLEKEATGSYKKAIWGRGLLGKIKSFLGQRSVAILNPPKGSPRVDTAHYALRGIKPENLDVTGTSQETRDSLRKLNSMPDGKASGVVGDIVRGDRAMELASLVRARSMGGKVSKERLDYVRNLRRMERQLRAREGMGIPPQGTTKGGDLSGPIIQEPKPVEPPQTTSAPKTRKPRKPRG